MSEVNKSIVRRWIEEIWLRGDYGLAANLLHPDLVDHMPAPGQAPGREGHLAKARAACAAFPDLQVSIDSLIAEADTVVDMWTFRASHTGAPFLGIPPSGRRVEFQGIDIVRICSGLITDIWHVEDFARAIEQLRG